MNEQAYKTFAENTMVALSNMNKMIKDVQNEAVVVTGGKLDDLEKTFKEYKNYIDVKLSDQNDLNLEFGESSKKVAKMENKLDTLEFDDEGKLQELRKIYQRRIFFLCGNDASNPEYILFNRSLLAQVTIYLATSLHVNKIRKIKIRDFEGSKVLARNYKPDRFKMNKKFKELFRQYEKETLTKAQTKAMEELLARMGGSFNMDKLFGGRCI